MPSSAPGATKEPRSREETRRSTALALGVLGGIIGGLMGLVFFAMAAFGLAIDAEATRAEETAVMTGTLALILLSILGAVGGMTARTEPDRGSMMLVVAGLGGVIAFLLMGTVEVTGLSGNDSEGFLVDAIWLIVGFWAIPAILFFTGSALAKSAAEAS